MAVGHRADPNALAALNSLVKSLEDQLTTNKFLTGVIIFILFFYLYLFFDKYKTNNLYNIF